MAIANAELTIGESVARTATHATGLGPKTTLRETSQTKPCADVLTVSDS